MKILIVRHGDPDYSIDSLTEKGWREAELLSERLHKLNVTEYYCSPLGRAKDTAAPTLKKNGKTAQICEWLKEFPGYIVDEETSNKRIPWDLLPNSWTNNNDFFDRNKWLETSIMQSGDVEEKYNIVCENFDKLLESHGYRRENNLYRAIHPNTETIVLFCHFGVECVLLSHMLNISPVLLWHGFVALPTSVTTLISEEREDGIAYFRCNGFGDLSHLYVADEPPSFAARFCETYSNFEERH